MCASTVNRRSPSSQDGPQSFPFISGVVAGMASYKNPSKVSLPWCSASHEVARADSSLFRDSPCLPRSARGAAACCRRSPASRDRRFCEVRNRRLRPCRRDSSVFSSTANCRLSASAPPTFVPRIGRSPVRRFFSILSAVSCKLSPARPERSRKVNCFAHFALCYLVPFHANTNCPICKSFVLITMQIAGGWGYLLEV
jgi:hypothetical protein